MKSGKAIAATLLVVVAIAWFATTRLWVLDPHEPVAVVKDGKVVEVLNCETPTAKDLHKCLTFVCERTWHERSLLPPYTQITRWKSHYGFGDAPTKSVHLAMFTRNEGAQFLKCEMDGSTVLSTAPINEATFNAF